MPPGDASHQNQDRLLQGWEAEGTYPNVKFDFLGYCFRPRWVKKSRDNSMFCGFTPAVSPSALKAMRATIRDLNIRRQTQLSLADIARHSIRSFGVGLSTTDDTRLRLCLPCSGMSIRRCVTWAMRKFKRFKAHKIRASHFLQELARENASLFVHWRIGMTGTFA